MSGTALQKVLNNAFKVAGKVLGFPFALYRPVSYTVPLQDANIIGTVSLGASPDEGFSKNPHEILDKYQLYLSAALVEPGDILHSDELSKTYIVIDKTELRAAVGVLAQDKFDILRPVLSAGDRKTSFELIGSSIPCALITSGNTGSDGALQGVTSTMSASSSDLEVWTWVTPGLIALNDVLEISSNRYLVSFVQSSAKGTHIKLRSTKVGK